MMTQSLWTPSGIQYCQLPRDTFQILWDCLHELFHLHRAPSIAHCTEETTQNCLGPFLSKAAGMRCVNFHTWQEGWEYKERSMERGTTLVAQCSSSSWSSSSSLSKMSLNTFSLQGEDEEFKCSFLVIMIEIHDAHKRQSDAWASKSLLLTGTTETTSCTVLFRTIPIRQWTIDPECKKKQIKR